MRLGPGLNGVSFYGRQVGVAANLVHSLTVVPADGRVTTVDATQDAELFWALRGGDGGLGVVISAEVELLPISYVFTGRAFWEVSDAPGVVAPTSLCFLELPRAGLFAGLVAPIREGQPA
ncbi:hypothetical protein [Actinoplanes solisilvae]|uniref:hypothetical protein n=1 Tax=Actinoplanes solisilvae TaxID=2486853 RepID=UPI000FDB4B93|nr:hypothetical protein [Actinoplanes solisilvae]